MKLPYLLQHYLDYILGIIMIISGAAVLQEYREFLDDPSIFEYIFWSIVPYVHLLVSGIIMMALPGKNMRRTIWLSGLILGVNLILLGASNFDTYRLYSEYKFELITYVASVFSFGIIQVGCGVAILINSVLFATKLTKSIYPLVISIVLAFTVDYFDASLTYSILVLDADFQMMEEYIRRFLTVYLPHMILLVLFTLLFLSDEVSWYTASGGMRRAMNRLHTNGRLFSIETVTRDQLILLMNSRHDFSTALRQDDYVCTLDVLFREGRKTLVFRRSGEDSMAGALYMDVTAVVPQGTLSECGYAEIFGRYGEYIRLRVVDSSNRVFRYRTADSLLSKGIIPGFFFSLPNISLYNLVGGTGRYGLRSQISKGSYEIEITASEHRRLLTIYRDGEAIRSMDVAAAVPICEFGAYTKLFIYSSSGMKMAFRIRSR